MAAHKWDRPIRSKPDDRINRKPDDRIYLPLIELLWKAIIYLLIHYYKGIFIFFLYSVIWFSISALWIWSTGPTHNWTYQKTASHSKNKKNNIWKNTSCVSFIGNMLSKTVKKLLKFIQYLYTLDLIVQWGS